MALSATTRRLLKETKELSAASPNPNPAFHTYPVSDTDLHEWHFTLLGPPAPSPYAGGLYHGRISLPPQYPYKPPNFRFLTPSGRFEVNREICLSISGFHEETWQPAWGVRTALTALRSFMAEPGTAGQVGGLESSEDVRRRLARESRGWKCAACGSGSNEERMREWWEVCRGKGVGVGDGGQEVGLDVLPEGVVVRPVEPKQSAETKTSPDSNPAAAAAAAASDDTAPAAAVPVPDTLPQDRASEETVQPQPQPRTRRNTIPIPQVPMPPGLQQRPTAAPAIEGAITIDRAIGVVFFALCLMILKKVFYPSSSGLLYYDDLRMVRE